MFLIDTKHIYHLVSCLKILTVTKLALKPVDVNQGLTAGSTLNGLAGFALPKPHPYEKTGTQAEAFFGSSGCEIF